MEISTVLFDLDGTLTDSGSGIINSVKYALKKAGREIPPEDELRKFIGPPLQEQFMKCCEIEEKEAAEMVGLYREYYQEKGIFDNWVYEGVMEMLKTLKEAGLTIVMATSKPEKFAKMIAEHFGFAKYFDLIGGACMNGARTKKQEVIQYVLGQCEEKDLEKIRMVGDRCYDIEGANREGIRAIGVLYGYGSKEELEEAGADGLAETPEEVVRVILNGMHP